MSDVECFYVKYTPGVAIYAAVLIT